MIADSIRTKYDRGGKSKDDDETMDLSDPKMVEKLKRMADAQY